MLGASKQNPLSHFINNISSYDSNIMLAAVISLLVVILFVLLLHIYAKWFLTQAHNRRRRSSSASVSRVLLPSRFNQHFYSFSYVAKGLHPSVISSIPLYVHRAEEQQGLECVICLGVFEENEVGRRLTRCGHGFHVDCVDMWLQSHSNCPICRAPVVVVAEIANNDDNFRSVEPTDEESTSAEIHVIQVSNLYENENGDNIVVGNHHPSPSSSLACSLKRMLSRSRSERNKVIPSSNNNDTQLGV